MKILVVDGDREARDVIAEILRQDGFETTTAESSKGALKALEECHDISVVILDLSLRQGGATEILALLRSSLRFQHVSSIVCSSTADPRAIKLSKELGAREYILKPFTREILVSRVRRALATSLGAVLVVDDDELIADLLTKVVKREGYEAFTAHSAEEALKIVAAEQIFAVFSDIAMPGMSGLELLAKLRETTPSPMVLLVTGESGKYSRQKVLTAGADGYVAKPFKNVEIAQKLGTLTQLYRQQLLRRSTS
jgi:CheY-like chemotaxis protein